MTSSRRCDARSRPLHASPRMLPLSRPTAAQSCDSTFDGTASPTSTRFSISSPSFHSTTGSSSAMTGRTRRPEKISTQWLAFSASASTRGSFAIRSRRLHSSRRVRPRRTVAATAVQSLAHVASSSKSLLRFSSVLLVIPSVLLVIPSVLLVIPSVLLVIPSAARDRFPAAAVEPPRLDIDPSSLVLLGMTQCLRSSG